MKNNKKKIICGILVFFVLLIVVIIFGINNSLSVSNNLGNDIYQNIVGQTVVNIKNNNEYLYKIKYVDNYEPGSKFDIYVYDNCDVLLDATFFSSIPDFEDKKIITKLVFNDSVKKELIDYFEYLFKNYDSNYINLYSETITDYDLDMINKIIKFDDSLLVDFKEYNLDENYDYKLFYNDISNCEIYILDDIVKVITKNIIDNSVSEHIINFSEDSMSKIDNMIKELFIDKSVKELKLEYNKMSYEQRDILDAIINNEEIFMNYIFKLVDVSCDCIANTVYFDSEYYAVRNAVDIDDFVVLSRGNHNYDINKILNNLDNLNENSDNINYMITLHNSEVYNVSHYDLIMVNLLKDLNIKWY